MNLKRIELELEYFRIRFYVHLSDHLRPKQRND